MARTLEVSKGAKIRNRYKSCTTHDPGYQWESDELKTRTTGQFLMNTRLAGSN